MNLTLMLPRRCLNIWSFTLLIFSLLPSLANAETIIAKYNAEWNGISAGEMVVSVDETATDYKYEVQLNSTGLVKTFTKYRSDNTSKGKIIAGKPLPETYKTEWWRKKGNEHQIINVVYKDGGKNVQETASPEEKRPKRPVVEGKYKNNTLDTVAAALWARKRIKEIAAAKPNYPEKFTMPVFDGRRRFDVEITINGYKKKKYQGKTQELLEIVFFRTPVNGFNEKELSRMKEQDPTVVFYLNSDYIPVMGTGAAPFGKANFELVSLCQSVDMACK